MSTKVTVARGMFHGINWKWIPLEAVGFTGLLQLALRLVFRVLPLNLVFVQAGIFVLSVLLSWKIMVRVRDVSSPSVSHGVLLGIVANVFYIGWTVMTMPEGSDVMVTFESALGSTMILLGCIAGGFLASRR